jgi:hypothetical protein
MRFPRLTFWKGGVPLRRNLPTAEGLSIGDSKVVGFLEQSEKANLPTANSFLTAQTFSNQKKLIS